MFNRKKSPLKSSRVNEERLSSSGSDDEEWSLKRSPPRKVTTRKSPVLRASSPPRRKTKKLHESATTKEAFLPTDLSKFKGLKIQAIVGVKEVDGTIFHLAKCDEKDELELIPALITMQMCPVLVVGFYQLRLSYITPDQDVYSCN